MQGLLRALVMCWWSALLIVAGTLRNGIEIGHDARLAWAALWCATFEGEKSALLVSNRFLNLSRTCKDSNARLPKVNRCGTAA
jgi:hypothetical protein